MHVAVISYAHRQLHHEGVLKYENKKSEVVENKKYYSHLFKQYYFYFFLKSYYKIKTPHSG